MPVKRFLLLFGYLVCSASMMAQSIYQADFTSMEIKPCPYDPAKITKQLRDWQVYQTTNGNWDGPVDSTRCISVETDAAAGAPFIRLNQIDPARPLFLRLKPESIQNQVEEFLPNAIYSVFGIIDLGGGNGSFATGTNCNQDLCTGVLLGISVPPPGPTRFHAAQMHPQYDFINACFPTERFDTQKLETLVIKLSFNPQSNWNNQIVKLHFLQIMLEDQFPGYIETVKADANDLIGTEYFVNVADVGGGFTSNYIMPYTGTGYPSAQTPSYVEAVPEPNVSTSQTINLTVDIFQKLEIQPFTYFRGALVKGSDTLRHRANIFNIDGDFCLNFVDLIFSDGSEYRHAGGQLTLNSAFSCLQFWENSGLRVMGNASLQYGSEGVGMLALCAGSHIVLERNARLTVDALLNIAECSHPYTNPDITVDLQPGSVLSFTENAWLTNRFSHDQQMKLKVRMLGGSLDDSALDAAERARIERVYPEPAPFFAQNIQLNPNPCSGQTVLQYTASRAETLELRWMDVNGRAAGSVSINVEKGFNMLPVKVPETPGVYWLQVRNATQQAVLKVFTF